MKTLTAEEQAMYREMLGARKRLQANDKDAMELVMDLVVDFGLWLERRKPKRRPMAPVERPRTSAQNAMMYSNLTPEQRKPKAASVRWKAG